MEAWIRTATGAMATVIDSLAALAIVWAALGAAFRLLASGKPALEPIRLQLGRWLLLALEFLLAADILRSTASPSWNELGQLAVLVVIRTVLDLFLARDVVTAEDHAPPPS